MPDDISNFSTLVATVAAVVVTAVATRISYYLAKNQSYPDVIVYPEHDVKRPTIITLVIKNVGKAAAINVRFYPNEPIPAHAFGFQITDEERSAIKPMSDGPLINGIPFLAPGATRVIDWGQYGGLSAVLGKRVITVKSEYYAKNISGSANELLKSSSYVDIESFAGTNASDLNFINVKSKDLEKISESLRCIASEGLPVKVRVE